MMSYFQLPSLLFWRRRKNDVDLETLFIRSERGKNAVTQRKHFAETPAVENAAPGESQKETVLPPTENILPPTENILPQMGNILPQTENILPPTGNILPQTEEYRPAAFRTEYGKRESESLSPEKHRSSRTASGEKLAFYRTGTEQTEGKFSAEQSSHKPQENAMPEKKSDAQLSAAIGALTECARGQLRYLKKNYDLLKTQTEERYFN